MPWHTDHIPNRYHCLFTAQQHAYQQALQLVAAAAARTSSLTAETGGSGGCACICSRGVVCLLPSVRPHQHACVSKPLMGITNHDDGSGQCMTVSAAVPVLAPAWRQLWSGLLQWR